MAPRTVARVLLHAPLPQLDRLLDYAIPPELTAAAVPGVRVRVPLRTVGRLVEGYIVELGEADDPDRPLSGLESVTSPAPVLPGSLYRLARRVADRAAGSASDVLRLVIPKRQVRIERAWTARRAVNSGDDGGDEAVPWVDRDAVEQRLAAFGGLEQALDEHRRLALLAPAGIRVSSHGETVGEWASIVSAAAAASLARGESAVIVAPDHRDLDQLACALREVVDDSVVIRDDSQLSGAERSRAYLRMLESEPCIVIGNRSAVYAPVSSLGALIVWDDGDPLMEEPLAPYAHARDAALVRQELDGCALVFAGHSRSTDVERLVAIGWVAEAVPPRSLRPRVVLDAPGEAPAPGRLPSTAFRAAREALSEGPVLIQVARPGYAPVLICAQCRTPARCTSCGGPLHARHRDRPAECRWCGRSANGWSCTSCNGLRLRLATAGSERTADELGPAFPGVRILVSDGSHRVTRVDDQPAIVIATRGAEPVAAGGYRAVLLLDGERMLLAESLRITEACLRWWSNAAALAAPNAPVHLVGVGGAIAQAFATWSHQAYARHQLAERAPLRLPPVARMAALDGPRRAVDAAIERLHEDVPALGTGAVQGPVTRATGHPGEPASERALIRFDYSDGPAVTESLRASVIQTALHARRPGKGRPTSPSHTLRVRVDLPEPHL